jgi:hypothetical protein
LHQERERGAVVKSETCELNRKTGELNRNTNVDKMQIKCM